MGRTKRACHLHLILCAWNAVITCTPVTVFFPLGVQLSPALQSPFSFHLGCGYDARKKTKQKNNVKQHNISPASFTKEDNRSCSSNSLMYKQEYILQHLANLASNNLTYSGKIWRALNLAKWQKRLYFDIGEI